MQVRVILSGGPLDGESYKFKDYPSNAELYFVYRGKRLLYKRTSEARPSTNGLGPLTYAYDGEDEWTWTNMKHLNL